MNYITAKNCTEDEIYLQNNTAIPIFKSSRYQNFVIVVNNVLRRQFLSKFHQNRQLSVIKLDHIGHLSHAMLNARN